MYDQLAVVDSCTDVVDIVVTTADDIIKESLGDDVELALALSVDFVVVGVCCVLLGSSAGKKGSHSAGILSTA
jgi:hypothetical protein